MMAKPQSADESTPAELWPNRRIIFLTVVIALIFYAVFRLPTAVNYVLTRARDILTLLILAVALTYFIQPFVDLLMRIRTPLSHRAQRGLAAFLALTILAVLVIALIAVTITPITEQIGMVLSTITTWAQQDLAGRVTEFIDELVQKLPEPYRAEAEEQIRTLEEQLTGRNLVQTLRSRISDWAGAILRWQVNLIGSVVSGSGYIIALLIVPVFSYYFLTDAGAIRDSVAMQFPPAARERYHRMVEDTDEVIERYVRTVMLISLITGLATALTLYFAGVRVYLTFGILAGVANMVPVVGAIVAVVMITAISLLQVGLSRTLIVVIVYGAIQLVTDRVLAPKLMSEGAKLHPVAVIVALLVGAEFFGVIGVFVAVPVLAALRVVYIHYRAYMSDEGHGRELEELLGRWRDLPDRSGPPGDDDAARTEAEPQDEAKNEPLNGDEAADERA